MVMAGEMMACAKHWYECNGCSTCCEPKRAKEPCVACGQDSLAVVYVPAYGELLFPPDDAPTLALQVFCVSCWERRKQSVGRPR